MSEIVVLDPEEVAQGRTELDITFHIGEAGPDWGDAAIEQFLADGYRGQVPVDFNVPNRTVTIPLVLHSADDDFTFDQMRQFVRAKAALFQREGGWLKREFTGGVVYADVVGATLHYGGSSAQARGDDDRDAVLTLECIPDFYGDEEQLTLHTESTNPELIFTETDIKGDYPGRVRMVVDEESSVAQRGLMWGVRARHYQDTDTARLAYEAEALTLQDATEVAGDVTASGFQAARHATVGRIATPVVGTDTTDGEMTHTGTYRVFARVKSTSSLAVLPNNVRVRFVWDVGDFTSPTENDWWPLPGANDWYIADLGEIRIDAPAAGAHRWGGQIQAQCLTGGTASVRVDRLWFRPADEGSGALSVPANGQASGAFTAFTAVGLSTTSETAGALNGKTMHTGGVWSTSGDATDFTVTVAGDGSFVTRSSVSDTAETGRLALAGSTTAGTLANQVLFQWEDVPVSSPVAMVYQRWSDDTHNIHARAFNQSGTGFVYVYYRNGGALTQLAQAVVPAFTAGTVYQLRMATDMTGAVLVWVNVHGQQVGDPAIVTSLGLLATGGALASGRHGFRDLYEAPSPTVDRFYSWYAAWPYSADAVLFPNQSADLTYGGMFRESSDGGSYGPVAHVLGDLPRLPPSGLESRTIEVFLKSSRGDFDSLPDSGIDDLSCRIFYRPSWLFVPEFINPDGLFPAVDLFPAPDLFPEL